MMAIRAKLSLVETLPDAAYITCASHLVHRRADRSTYVVATAVTDGAIMARVS